MTCGRKCSPKGPGGPAGGESGRHLRGRSRRADVAQRYPALVVLPSAYETARNATGNVAKVLKALDILGRAATEFAAGGGDPYDALRTSGLKVKSDISDYAKQKHRAAYEVADTDGSKVMLGPHFDLGKKTTLLRVYFAIDAPSRRVIVGHVGGHLPDKSS